MTIVPNECPESYDILFVGEAPGGEEVGQGRPFVGKSGQLLERYINRNGKHREEVGLANLCQVRPKGNKFETLLGTSALNDGLDALEEEINRAKPKCIVALGGWPLWYLTGKSTKRGKKPNPGSGILTYRGSRLKSTERWGKYKVFATTHPSYVLRNWRWNPVFNLDIQHAIEDSAFRGLRLPKYDEFIDPEREELLSILDESLGASWLSVDIETFPNGRFSCIGWAWEKDGREKACTVTYLRPDLHQYVQEMWESDAPKIFQYGTYDTSFMRNFYGWKIGGFYDGIGWDTYVASASLLPDYPRGLDFLASIYTRFPYYKTDRKVWKEKEDLNILWRYNLKDVVCTMHIAKKQMGEIKEVF